MISEGQNTHLIDQEIKQDSGNTNYYFKFIKFF